MSYFIIAPLETVKGENSLPEFNDARRALANAVHQRAATLFQGYQPGGILPEGRQYGVGPLRKNDMAGDTADATTSGSYSFTKNITATGWQDIFNYTVRDSEVHGFDGFAVSDPTLKITQIRMEIGDRKFPIMDLQEAQIYDRYSIIIKTDQGKELVADPGTVVLVRIYAESIGNQRVIPLGLNAYQRKDILLAEA